MTDRAKEGVRWFLLGLALICLFSLSQEARQPRGRHVVINEVLARNRFTNFDEDEQSSDWLEIHNVGSRSVDLTDFRLSTDPRYPEQWRFPEVHLSPGGFLLVWCSGKNLRSVAEGGVRHLLHTNFQLGGVGQTVLLSDPQGELLDAVVLPPQTEDRSYGRSPNGTGSFTYHLRPTPMQPNRGPLSRETIPSRPTFDPPGGLFGEPVELAISADFPLNGVQIRFTTNGSAPTSDSPLYESPLSLVPGDWHAGTVVRAAAFVAKERVSQIETQSYFFNAAEYELPILSISMEPEDFREVHLRTRRRGRRSERPAYVEVFDASGLRATASGMGIRLHGVAGRFGGIDTKKSYRLYFRDVYGNKKLKYRIIPETEIDTFDRLVLRSNMEDAFRDGRRATYLRDELMRELFGDMGNPTARGAWHNLFVNMEYRGVYNTVERMDRFFFQSHFPEEGVGWDVVNGGDALEGDLSAWNAMLHFFNEHDLRDPRRYGEAAELIDLGNFTDYLILNIWAQNHDWPHKNYFAARPRRKDGRWIFLCWDGEFGFALYPTVHDADTFERACTRRDSPVGEILVSLLKNPDYQRLFLERFDRHLVRALHPDNVILRVRRNRELIASDMRKEISATFPDLDPDLWAHNVDEIEAFARLRGDAIRRHVFGSPRITVPRVASITPQAAVAGSRTELELGGYGFTAGTRVHVNGVAASIVGVPSSTSIRILLPDDARVKGLPDITVSDHDKGEVTVRGLLKVISRAANEP